MATSQVEWEIEKSIVGVETLVYIRNYFLLEKFLLLWNGRNWLCSGML